MGKGVRMNKILSIPLGAILLGVTLMVAQPAAYAQETPPPFDSAAERAAETAAQQAARAAENAAQAVAIEEFRDDEEDDTSDAAFMRDVGNGLGTVINRTIEYTTNDELRAQDALQGDQFWMEERERRFQETQGLRGQDAEERATMAREREADQGYQGADDQARHLETLQRAAERLEDRAQMGDNQQTPVNIQQATSLGKAIKNIGESMKNLPSLTNIASYTAGVFLMWMGMVKLNRSVMEPSRNPVSDGVKYLAAGVFLSALPMTTTILHESLGWQSAGLELNYAGVGGGDGGEAAAQGLDQFMVKLVRDIVPPTLALVTMFGFVAGVFLLFLALQRLTKGAQEGPKGPAGLGTLMMFVVGSALISFVPALRTVMYSVFGTNTVATFPQMTRIAERVGVENMTQATTVITALLAFLAIVGVISFARGLFMLKDTADGAQNASLMGSMSHIIAGVCCVNFGAFANMLQNTLGLTEFGINFTTQ